MIYERVKAAADSLTPAEQRLVRELLARPRAIALGTAGELARRIGVHEATVSRLARKLGFETYADFRDSIRQEFIVAEEPASRLRNTLASARDADLVADLVAAETDALSRLATFVPAAAIAAAAAPLVEARKVFLFARGNAEALGVLMERRLRRMGADPVLLSGDGRDLAERLLAMREGDALLAFAFRRQPRRFAALLDHARGLGVASVVVSDLVGPALVPVPDHLLFAPRSGSSDAFQTLTVPMTICNLLVLQMAKTAEASSLTRLERLGAMIGLFEGR